MKKIILLFAPVFIFCLSSWAQVNVVISLSPPDTSICQDETVMFTANVTGCPAGYTIFWKDGFQIKDTCISPCSTYVVTNLIPGSHLIWCTADCNPNGFDDSNGITLNVANCAGVEEYANGTLLTLYPNPSTDIITIDTEKLKMFPASLKVFDNRGRVVDAGYEIKNRSAVLNATQFPDGIYYYRIADKTGDKTATGKFMISK